MINTASVDTSKFAKETDLANSTREVHKSDNDKLAELDANKFKAVSVDLRN